MRKGLTLMELLVAISILATLAALLFPVYLNVRTRMYTISCANQLRQIGLALRMYVHDHGDETPYAIPHRLGQLYPHYVSDKGLLVCTYFRTLAPEVAEEMHQIYQARWGYPWSSYHEISPQGWDDIAEKNPAEVISFKEVFAQRGDQTPIVLCLIHRIGCPDYGYPLMLGPKGTEFAKTYCNLSSPLINPSAPLVILRWGGSVHLVYKGGLLEPTNTLLMEY